MRTRHSFALKAFLVSPFLSPPTNPLSFHRGIVIALHCFLCFPVCVLCRFWVAPRHRRYCMQQRRTPSAKIRTTALYWGVCANEATANPRKNHAHIIHVNSISIHHEMRSFPARTRARGRARAQTLPRSSCLSLSYIHTCTLYTRTECTPFLRLPLTFCSSIYVSLSLLSFSVHGFSVWM